MLKKLLPVIVCALMLGACQKKHEDGTPAQVGSMPGAGVTSISKYGGAISASSASCFQTCVQTVNVNANVIDYPSDREDIYLCRNFDCSTGTLPSVDCATVWNQPAAACYMTTPSVQITSGRGTVSFVNATDKAWADAQHTVLLAPGYSSYFIETTVTR